MTDDLVYLKHILDAIEKIESYVLVGCEVFMSTSHWQDAVIRQLEIIGEATKRLSQNIRSQYHEVPWRRIAGLRMEHHPHLHGDPALGDSLDSRLCGNDHRAQARYVSAPECITRSSRHCLSLLT